MKRICKLFSTFGLATVGVALLLGGGRGLQAADAPRAAQGLAKVDFNRDVQPLLSDRCYFCHGPDAGKRKAKLRLDTQEGALARHGDHAAIVPGKADQSELVRRITSTDPDVQMPPPKSHRTLNPAEIDILRRWVEQGAPFAKHWSLVPPVRPALPEVKDKSWPRNPIDSFILARLEQEGLTPSPEADKTALIRRVTLDLTGLPPTLAEVDGFLKDPSPDAYEKVVDRLLASPRYGERMVWEWLDAARYADTNGYQGDKTRTMWPWRDWAVRAFNDNMPFDRFSILQIAGDLLPNATTEDRLATGFCRNHMINGEGGRIAEENRVDYVLDQTETVGTVWLGVTIGCAKCHDHKYDPWKQKDYYSLSAFFNNTPVNGGDGSGQAGPVVDLASDAQKAQLKKLDDEVAERAAEVADWEKEVFPAEDGKSPADSPAAQKLTGSVSALLKQPPQKRYVPSFKQIIPELHGTEPEYADAAQRFFDALDARDKVKAVVPRVMVMQEMPKPRETFVLVKGSYDKHADPVTARTPEALEPMPSDAPHNRLGLAEWLVAPENPLTARVTVNRWWQQFFGTGIVKTVDDFGLQGEKPSHPELLDWLACEFRQPTSMYAQGQAWNVKALVRLIVTSSTYRQSAKVTPALVERDPQNRLLARGPRFRLPAFVLRDQALAASGLLVEQLGGPPVKPYQPPGIWEEATFGQIRYQQDHGPSLYRRSLYTFWRRIVGPTEFFDVATRQNCTVKVSRTNTPLHALTTLNDTTYVEAARALAQRAMHEGGDAPAARLTYAWRLVLSRKPNERELAVLTASYERLKHQYTADRPAALKLLSVGESKRDEKLDPAEHAAYTGVCSAILNLDEALTK